MNTKCGCTRISYIRSEETCHVSGELVLRIHNLKTQRFLPLGVREHFGGTFLLARNLATRGFLTFCVCEHFGGTILFGWNFATEGFVTLGECVFPGKLFVGTEFCNTGSSFIMAGEPRSARRIYTNSRSRIYPE